MPPFLPCSNPGPVFHGKMPHQFLDILQYIQVWQANVFCINRSLSCLMLLKPMLNIFCTSSIVGSIRTFQYIEIPICHCVILPLLLLEPPSQSIFIPQTAEPGGWACRSLLSWWPGWTFREPQCPDLTGGWGTRSLLSCWRGSVISRTLRRAQCGTQCPVFR